MAKSTTKVATAKTEASYPGKRVLRTALQVVFSIAIVSGLIAALAPDLIAKVANILPGEWVVTATSIVAAITAVSTGLTKLMSLPAVEAVLKKIGLGSVKAETEESLGITENDIRAAALAAGYVVDEAGNILEQAKPVVAETVTAVKKAAPKKAAPKKTTTSKTTTSKTTTTK